MGCNESKNTDVNNDNKKQKKEAETETQGDKDNQQETEPRAEDEQPAEMTPEEQADLKRSFEKVDSDNTGYVSKDEAVLILKSKFELDEENLQTIVHEYDHDGDNKIKYAEFIDFRSKVKNKSAEAQELFDSMDADDSGDLNMEELMTSLQEKCDLEPFMIKGILLIYDKNKDGKINKAEFIEAWNNLIC